MPRHPSEDAVFLIKTHPTNRRTIRDVAAWTVATAYLELLQTIQTEAERGD